MNGRPQRQAPAVGEVWQDTYISNPRAPWFVWVVRLNEESVRVEPCDPDGTRAGATYGYRMQFKHFANGRMVRAARLRTKDVTE